MTPEDRDDDLASEFLADLPFAVRDAVGTTLFVAGIIALGFVLGAAGRII